MVVIPITGGVLGLLALPFLPWGFIGKLVAAIVIGQLFVAGVCGFIVGYNSKKKEALK